MAASISARPNRYLIPVATANPCKSQTGDRKYRRKISLEARKRNQKRGHLKKKIIRYMDIICDCPTKPTYLELDCPCCLPGGPQVYRCPTCRQDIEIEFPTAEEDSDLKPFCPCDYCMADARYERDRDDYVTCSDEEENPFEDPLPPVPIPTTLPPVSIQPTLPPVSIQPEEVEESSDEEPPDEELRSRLRDFIYVQSEFKQLIRQHPESEKEYFQLKERIRADSNLLEEYYRVKLIWRREQLIRKREVCQKMVAIQNAVLKREEQAADRLEREIAAIREESEREYALAAAQAKESNALIRKRVEQSHRDAAARVDQERIAAQKTQEQALALAEECELMLNRIRAEAACLTRPEACLPAVTAAILQRRN